LLYKCCYFYIISGNILKGENMKATFIVLLMLLAFLSISSKSVPGKTRYSESTDVVINELSIRSVTFQGYLTDSSGVEVEGAVLLSCTLWTDSAGGVSVWGADSVMANAKKGVVTEVLSLPYDAFANNKTLYMGISINGEYLGRLQITSSLWSYISERSDTSKVSLNTQRIGGNLVSGTEPTTGYVLRWSGSEWIPSADTSGGYSSETFLNNVNDSFGILEGDSIKLEKKLSVCGDNRTVMSVNPYETPGKSVPYIVIGDSSFYYTYPSYLPKEWHRAVGYVFTELSDTSQKIQFDGGSLYATNNAYIGETISLCKDWIDSASTPWLWGAQHIIKHGNVYIYDDVTLVGDTLSNNQAYLGLLDVTDSSMMQMRPYSLRSFKSFTSPSRDTDSTYWTLNNDGYILTNYASNSANDTTVQIKSGYLFAKDSIKLNTGESVTKFIKVGSHAGIIFSETDTFWLAKDTLGF